MILLLCYMNMEDLAGNYRPAELRLVDTHEVDQFALRFRTQGLYHQHRGGLRHRLDNQHPRHYRPRREVPPEIIFVTGYVLDPHRALVGDDADNTIDHQKRIAVRDHL